MKFYYNSKYYNDNILLELQMISERGDELQITMASLDDIQNAIDNTECIKEYVVKQLNINDTEEKILSHDFFKRYTTPEGHVIESYFIDSEDVTNIQNKWIQSTSNLTKENNIIEWTENIEFKYINFNNKEIK